jgi:PIN domain nuclease of toxin-antitoxin system
MGEWVRCSVRELGLQETSFTSAVAHELPSNLLGYRDPGDRFLVATAQDYDLILVTADERWCRQEIPNLQLLTNFNGFKDVK